MSENSMSQNPMTDVEYVPTLATDDRPEKTRLEVPHDVSRNLMKVQNETVHDHLSSKDVPDVSVGEFVNPAPKCIEPTKPSLADDEVSSVELNDGEHDWVDIDDEVVPAVGKTAEEAGWETVDLASGVIKRDLTGEDEYAIESFRSSKKKEYLLSKLGDEIEQVKVDVVRAKMMTENKKAADLMERMRIMMSVKDELETKVEE